MKKLISILALMSLAACSSDDNTGVDAGAAFSTVSSALGSIANLAPTSFAGVANAHCTATGSPISDGIEMTEATAGYMGGVGYCQTTFNTVSPDTVRGAMHIGSGMLCEAAAAGLFATPGSVTQDFVIDTDCWGTAAEVEALKEDLPDTIPGVTITVEDVSASTDYSFRVDLDIPAFNSVLSFYLLNSGGVIAGLNTTDGWAFKFDTNTGILLFESVDVGSNRRNRLMVQGALNGSNEYTAISNISGFQEQSGSLYTFSGTLQGLLGDFYNGNDSDDDRTGECYAPGGSEDCSGVVALTANDTNSLRTNADADAAALSASTTPISFSTVDPTDTSIVD